MLTDLARQFNLLSIPSLSIQRAGYQIGFTNQSGVNPFNGRLDPLAIKRLAIESYFSDAYFRGILAFPRLAYPWRAAAKEL